MLQFQQPREEQILSAVGGGSSLVVKEAEQNMRGSHLRCWAFIYCLGA